MALTWKQRLTIVLTVFWLGGMAAASIDPGGFDWEGFLLGAALPCAMAWSAWWVWAGWRASRRQALRQ